MTTQILNISNWFDTTWIKTKVETYFAILDRNKQIKETIKELNKLSDKELWDIGITRGDIYSVAHEVHYDDRLKVNKNLKGWV